MPSMEAIVSTTLAKLSAPHILVFLDWDAVADDPRPFSVYCDASIDAFGTALNQKQPHSWCQLCHPRLGVTLDSARLGS